MTDRNGITEQAFAGYIFRDPEILREALTHPSVNAQLPKASRRDYERLEFLGDSVLGLVIAEMLLDMYPDDSESELARRHAVLVSGKTLAKIAAVEGIGRSMILSEGEEKNGGRDNKRNLANVTEALLGAVHTDGGFDTVRAIIIARWQPAAAAMAAAPKDAKTALQEISQSQGLGLPEYVTVNDGGDAHQPSFTATVTVGALSASAAASKKKTAEQEAAIRWLSDHQPQDNDNT